MRRSRTVITFSDLPRGRHELEPTEVVLVDPLGLERVEQRLDERTQLLIRPRIPVLTSVFSTYGSRETGAARSRFRRPTGFEIHAVREYAPGEPLRAVHWPSTARRGRLMVKELDDAPRDDLAVILDQDEDGVAGLPGRSSFDAAVRAAGALTLAHALWNRRVVLIGTAAGSEGVRVRSPGHDWEIALDALARVMPVGGLRWTGRSAAPSTAISRAREIVVVTGRPDRAVEPLLELRRGGRSVSLVVVASETFAGRPRRPARDSRPPGRRPGCARRRDLRRHPDRDCTRGAAERGRQCLRAGSGGSSPRRSRSPQSHSPGRRSRSRRGRSPSWASRHWPSPCPCPRGLIRVVAALAVLLGLTIVLAGSSVGAVRDVVDQGLSDIYAVAPPFVVESHPELNVLVILTACAFCLAVAVTAGSRPFVAAAITAAGLGWPATILPARNTIAMGALGLFAALWPVVIAGLRDRRGLVPGTAKLAGVVVVAAMLAGAGARPSVAALDWKNWDLFGESEAGHTVALVWRSDYGGIDFPAGKTTVLRITAPRRALYWRATTLDTFASDHWVETLYATGDGVAEQTLPLDPLLPAAAAKHLDWVKQEVNVRALVDDHVIAAGQPMSLSGGKDTRIRFLSGGVMSAPQGLADMRHYTVWSYAPRPTPAALDRSPPAIRAHLRAIWTSAARLSLASVLPAGRLRSTPSSATISTRSCGRTSRCGPRRGA